MASTDPGSLERLHDIVTSPPVPFLPPAPGWYVLGLAAVMGLALLVAHAIRRWRADAYRRAAMAELAACTTPAERLAAMPSLLKRVALTAFGREEVAALSGQAWLAWLDRTGGTKGFSQGDGRVLGQLVYDPAAWTRLSANEIEAAVGAGKAWIRGHRAGRP